MNTAGAVGFIGLGRAGGILAGRLVRAGYAVAVFDLDADRMQAAAAAGGRPAGSAAAAAGEAATVLTCLPDPATTKAVAEEDLLPAAVAGQTYIDLGVNGIQEARRLHRLYAEVGAGFLDAPLSGGATRAETEDEATASRLCVGGVQAAFEREQALLQALVPSGEVLYCGPAGSGQAVHAARLVALGVGAAGFLEALALARAAGVEAGTVRQAVGDTGGWSGRFAAAAAAVEADRPEEVETALEHWDDLLRDANAYGLELPLSAALAAVQRAGLADEGSFWNELGRRRGEILKARYMGHGKAEKKDPT